MPGFNIVDNNSGPVYTDDSTRKHRYLVEFLGPLSRNLLLFAHKVGIPNIESDRIVMHRGFDEIYFPGKLRWLPIEISFYRTHKISDDAASEIYNWWSEGLYDIFNSRLTVNDHDTVDKRDVVVNVLDGIGDTVYKYFLYGCWPSKISPDPLDYSDTAISSITITLQVDKMKEEAINAIPGALIDPCIIPRAAAEENPLEEEENPIQLGEPNPQVPPEIGELLGLLRAGDIDINQAFKEAAKGGPELVGELGRGLQAAERDLRQQILNVQDPLGRNPEAAAGIELLRDQQARLRDLSMEAARAGAFDQQGAEVQREAGRGAGGAGGGFNRNAFEQQQAVLR